MKPLALVNNCLQLFLLKYSTLSVILCHFSLVACFPCRGIWWVWYLPSSWGFGVFVFLCKCCTVTPYKLNRGSKNRTWSSVRAVGLWRLFVEIKIIMCVVLLSEWEGEEGAAGGSKAKTEGSHFPAEDTAGWSGAFRLPGGQLRLAATVRRHGEAEGGSVRI